MPDRAFASIGKCSALLTATAVQARGHSHRHHSNV